MKKEVILLLFIIGFIAVAYVLMLSGEKSIKKNMSTSKITEPTVTPTQKQFSSAPAMEIDVKKSYTAVIKTNKGDITVQLFTADTPKTVNNFVFLARKNFYDGVIFHRVMKGFMIQGGDPDGIGTGGPGYAFADEFVPNRVFDKPGLLAMANSGPNTNGSQFFITVAQTPWLTGKHTIFGEVTKGMDVVKAIETVQTGEGDKPIQDVTISHIDILEQ